MRPINLLSFLCLCIALTGCGSHQIGHKHPVTGICKSCKPYFVRGSWHYPQTHYHYDEIGLASWYGPGFHGKPKPYGELFNQHAMTAAHKTLPLPTIVLVTNLETGKTIKVLVDDRGPFVYEGRIIDLSMGAAKALGCYNKGTAKVRVEALVDESKALANYLTRYGTSGRDPSGRTWWQIYEQEIAGRYEGGLVGIPPAVLPLPEVMKPQPAPKSVVAPSLSVQSIDNLLKNLEPPSAAKPAAIKPQKATAPLVKEAYIQVGGHFVQRKNAEAVLVSVAPYYPAKIVEILHPTGQKFYAVQAGPFKDEKTAQIALKRLADKDQLNAVITGR